MMCYLATDFQQRTKYPLYKINDWFICKEFRERFQSQMNGYCIPGWHTLSGDYEREKISINTQK